MFEGKLVVKEKISVKDLEIAKAILEMLIEDDANTLNLFMRISGEKEEIEKITDQLQFGGLLKGYFVGQDRYLQLTEKGKQWLKEKIIEFE